MLDVCVLMELLSLSSKTKYRVEVNSIVSPRQGNALRLIPSAVFGMKTVRVLRLNPKLRFWCIQYCHLKMLCELKVHKVKKENITMQLICTRTHTLRLLKHC